MLTHFGLRNEHEWVKFDRRRTQRRHLQPERSRLGTGSDCDHPGQFVTIRPLPARQTLDRLGVPRTTFYRWYDKYLTDGVDGLEDKSPKPPKVWNRIPDDIQDQIIDLALEEPELSPRELAVRFTDTKGYFVSEASVYRLLKAHDLITSPAFVVIKAASAFKDKTTAINQMWQTDFTYIKIIGWGGFTCRPFSTTSRGM